MAPRQRQDAPRHAASKGRPGVPLLSPSCSMQPHPTQHNHAPRLPCLCLHGDHAYMAERFTCRTAVLKTGIMCYHNVLQYALATAQNGMSSFGRINISLPRPGMEPASVYNWPLLLHAERSCQSCLISPSAQPHLPHTLLVQCRAATHAGAIGTPRHALPRACSHKHP